MQLPRPIPAFKDNYIWMMTHPESKTAMVVDPGEAAPVLKMLAENNLTLTTIFVTHHHYDHSGGAQELMQQTGAKVYGPNSRLFTGANPLQDGERINFPGTPLTFTTLTIPGHTLDHIALFSSSQDQSQNKNQSQNQYQSQNQSQILDQPILFCGDTLFTGGCGRVFEGTAEQMLNSLQKLKNLPPSTLIYCGHEYTEANLKFAHHVEPDNAALLKRMEDVVLKRKTLQPTVPSTLAEELNTNPFLRTDQDSVHQAAEVYAAKKLTSEEEVFATIRKWKNDFS